MNYWLNLDYRLFEFFNAWAGKNSAANAIIIFFAQYVIWFVYAGLCLWWFLGKDRIPVRQRLVLIFSSVVLGRGMAVEIIRAIYHRARPFLAYRVTKLIHVVLLLGRDNEGSFPSGHTTIMFAIAGALYFYNKKLAGRLVLLGLLIGLARVSAGIHYPGDILGGIIVGLISAWLIEKTLGKKIQNLAVKLSNFSDKILPFPRR